METFAYFCMYMEIHFFDIFLTAEAAAFLDSIPQEAYEKIWKK